MSDMRISDYYRDITSTVALGVLLVFGFATDSSAQIAVMNKNYLLNELTDATQTEPKKAAVPDIPAPELPQTNENQESVSEQPAPAKKKMFFAGSDVSSKGSFSTIAGVIAPLPIADSDIGNGWVARMVGFAGRYEYKSGTNTIQARGVSGGLALGYVESGEKGWWGAYMGPNMSYNKLSPDDVSNKSRGRQWALDTQIGGERSLTKDFKLNGSISYQFFNNNNFWSRVRPLMRLEDNIFIGPEFVYQGDNSYRAGQIGAVVTGFDLGHDIQLGLKAGMQKTKDESAGAYVGFEIGGVF